MSCTLLKLMLCSKLTNLPFKVCSGVRCGRVQLRYLMMATPALKCSQKDVAGPKYPVQTKEHPQRKWGKSKPIGETDRVPKVLTETKLMALSPVNWDRVDRVPPSPYTHIDYRVVIMNERTPDLFQPDREMLNFIGAIYVSTARGVSPHEPRRVFLDAANPANLVMRVPQSVDDDDKVVSYYSWSRTNFVYQEHGSPERGHLFQLFTPANLGTHGATVTDEGVLIFTALPPGTRVEDRFSYFQIKRGQNQAHITTEHETLGLYVDTDDGWKVKVTSDTSMWDMFEITGLKSPKPSIFHPLSKC